MIIAIMSDSHDNIWHMHKALEIVKNEKAEMIIHCGDFVAPFMLKELEEADIPVHGVFGNNDGDKYLTTKMSLTMLKNITLHGIIGKLKIDNINFCFTHYEDIAEGLAATEKYDIVCFGHSHKYSENKVGKTILLNPGEILGKEGCPGFCIFDTKNLSVKRIDLFNR